MKNNTMKKTYQKNIELQPKVLRNGCLEVDSNELVGNVKLFQVSEGSRLIILL